MKENFKIQIPNSIVRSSTFSPVEFVIIGNLIQAYYMQPGDNKQCIFQIDHSLFMCHSKVKKNETFKKYLSNLYNNGIILNEIEKLPRKEGLEIHINPNLINPEYFTQMDYTTISRKVIDKVGHTGIRLLYYYESFINRKENKQFTFVSVETIQKETGLSNKTITEYNKKLKAAYFIKVETNPLEHEYFTTKKGERLLFTKYNNHYYVKQENINKFVNK